MQSANICIETHILALFNTTNQYLQFMEDCKLEIWTSMTIIIKNLMIILMVGGNLNAINTITKQTKTCRHMLGTGC